MLALSCFRVGLRPLRSVLNPLRIQVNDIQLTSQPDEMVKDRLPRADRSGERR